MTTKWREPWRSDRHGGASAMLPYKLTTTGIRPMSKHTLLWFTAAISLTCGSAQAHHSFASEFDADQPVMLAGVITKVEFINPHSWIHIAVTREDGAVENWEIEGGTPNTLFRRGINDNTLPIGAEVFVEGYRARDGSQRASGRDITFPDGRKLFLSGSAPSDE